MQQLHHEDDAKEMVIQMQRANGLEPKGKST